VNRQIECPFEADTLSAAVQGRWPERVDDELRAHVHSCRICTDVAAVAAAIDATRDEMRVEIVVPDSGKVWWLAQLRARREAAQTAARPITAAQVVAFGSIVALLGACFGATSTWFQSLLLGVAGGIRNIDAQAVIPLLMEHGAIAAAMIVIAILIPAVVYLTVSKD
jgi:hypothetical protein